MIAFGKTGYKFRIPDTARGGRGDRVRAGGVATARIVELDLGAQLWLHVGRGLIDRYGNRSSHRFGLLAGMNRSRFEVAFRRIWFHFVFWLVFWGGGAYQRAGEEKEPSSSLEWVAAGPHLGGE